MLNAFTPWLRHWSQSVDKKHICCENPIGNDFILKNGRMMIWEWISWGSWNNCWQLQLQPLQLQKALFDTNIHEHNNNIHVIMLCLETLIKVYTYRLHKSHQGRSDGIRVILNTIAYDQRNKTAFCMKWTHSFSQWAAVYKWTNEI